MSKLQVSTQKAVFIYLLTSLFLCFEMGLQVSPSVMTHHLMRSLDITVVGLGFMSGFYFYTYTLMQIPAGILFDRFQVRWVVVFPLLLCALGAVVFSFAHSIVGGTVGRLLMGLGSAFAFISVLVVAGDLFQDKYFAFFAGMAQMLAAFGAMLGEAPLVPLVAHIGWRDTMRFLAGIALILSFMIWFFVRYEKCDTFKERDKSHPPHIVASLKNICAKPQSWLIAVYACALWAPMAAFASLWGVPYLEVMYSLPKSQATEVMALMWLGIAFGSPLLGWASDAFKSRRWPLTISAVLGFLAFFVINMHSGIPIWLLAILIFIAGAACSGQALSFAVVKDNSDEGGVAAAIGFNNMAVVIAGAIFQPAVAMFIGDESVAHFQQGMNLIVGCYLVGAIMAFFFIRSKVYD